MSEARGIRACITGTGMYVPPRVVTNFDLMKQMDTSDEFLKFFEGTWPKALNKLKEISERNAAASSEVRKNAI